MSHSRSQHDIDVATMEIKVWQMYEGYSGAPCSAVARQRTAGAAAAVAVYAVRAGPRAGAMRAVHILSHARVIVSGTFSAAFAKRAADCIALSTWPHCCCCSAQVQTVGSGFIQLPPQKRFEGSRIMQPPTLAVRLRRLTAAPLHPPPCCPHSSSTAAG